MLAEHGHTDGLGLVLKAVNDESLTDPVRNRAVKALRWFSGPAVWSVLDSLLRSETNAERRKLLYQSLASANPSDAIPWLIDGLQEENGDVWAAAKEAMLATPTPVSAQLIEARVDEVEEDVQISLFSVLQSTTGRPFPSEFREYLERVREEPIDIFRAEEALRGLQQAFTWLPFSDAVAALSARSSSVRVAAILGLAQHPDRREVRDALNTLAQSRSETERTTAEIALWAVAFMERQDRLLDQGYEAVSRGEFFEAHAYAYRAHPLGAGSRVPMTPLKILQINLVHWSLPGLHYFSERQHELSMSLPLVLGQALPSGQAGIGTLEDLRSYLDTHPHRIDDFLDNPLYDHLHDFYAFRVLTGLQEPIWVEDWPGVSPDEDR
jgi:hypothetical protein